MRAVFIPFFKEVRNIKSKTYEEFVEKFKPKKTTDDCYTPPEIYEVIKDWVCKRYNIDPGNVIRPFWSGGDYEKDEYLPGCVVVDNHSFEHSWTSATEREAIKEL